MRTGLVAFIVASSAGHLALADPGDAEKAQAMLARVVVAVQQDQTAAIETFTAGSDDFKDGDTYPFCYRLSDGIVITGQTAGKDIGTFPGTSGQQIFEAAYKPDDVTTEITYLARRPPPAPDPPTRKVSLVRRLGQTACGVGYYP
jgi:hypothetical protein